MTTSSPTRRLRVLHLAFEDHRRPGSGGGSARNQAVNSRLAEQHDITVVTAGYAGARPRTEDGVRYEHLGVGSGYWTSLLSYFLLLPWTAWRRGRDYDLVIEEFAAPLSSMSVSRWTRRPTLAVVQWLNAREKSRQYRMPFFLFESAGVRAHDRYVAVSQDLGDVLTARHPGADVTVVPNGVEPEALEARSPVGSDIVFLGRLEIAQKGLDLLLDAFASIADRVEGDLLLAGDGPDLPELRRRVTRLGLDDRVRFLGRVDGQAKYELLASARVVAMPSRYETFGMVAVEAQACGAPVVAFDIPCLREVVPADSGRLVAESTAAAFAAGLLSAYQDDDLRRTADAEGRVFARQFSWDRIAADQEAAYLSTVAAAV